MKQSHVVVLGGGYSGALAARRLAHRVDARQVAITLVNGSPDLRERVRSHQVAANERVVQISFRRLLARTNVRFLAGWVTRVIPESRQVTVQTSDGPQTLDYDYLIYALGSFVDVAGVPGAAEYALSVSTPETTLNLREQVPQVAARQGRLVVCGGGLSGIEVASELAEAYPDLKVSLITRGRFGSHLSRRGGGYLRDAFNRLDIEVIEQAAVTRITPNRVEWRDGSQPYDLCVWAGGFAVSSLAREAGLTVNSASQIVVDGHLRSVSHPEIYAVGDSADLSSAIETPIRMACATALPLGAYAADDIAAKLRTKPQRPYEFAYTLRCISLGRHEALVQVVDADDKPKEQIITGWLGALIKEALCQYAIWQIWNDRWMYYPRRSAAARKTKSHGLVGSSGPER